ncbi:MAG: hypothetical protein J2P49_06885 [Methylocapsa sp.]|nr:hypothetical protein [Methylocapsa sp.]
MKKRSPSSLKKCGFTNETFRVFYEDHKGCCAICGVSEDDLERVFDKDIEFSPWTLHIDHDHQTGKVRPSVLSMQFWLGGLG